MESCGWTRLDAPGDNATSGEAVGIGAVVERRQLSASYDVEGMDRFFVERPPAS